MKITNDYLIAQGFKKQDDLWLNFDEGPKFYIQIRKAPGSDGFRLEIQRFKTKEFGVYGVNITPDNDGCLFMGYVTTIEEMETIIKACGIKTTPKDKRKATNWRKRFPHFLVRCKRFKVFVMYEDEALFTGFETDDYNEAMEEINRRNKELILKK